MPRGVYPRKSADKKTAKKGAAKGARKARARAKPAKQGKAAPAAPLLALVTTPAAQLAEPQFSSADFRGSIDNMAGPLLRAYARRIGILQRDVDGLTEDRLRQNCKARVLEMMED